jgi:hypothetical protein
VLGAERGKRPCIGVVDAADGVLEVETAERFGDRAAAPVLVSHRRRHEQERSGHEQVPLPPCRVPVACERHRDERLGEQDPGREHRDEQERRAPLEQLGVAPRCERVEGAAGDREADERTGGVARWQRLVERRPRASDQTAHPASTIRRPKRSDCSCRMSARLRAAPMSRPESAAKQPPRKSPTGVATTNPVFLPASSTPGVASACSARKPLLARKTSETRKTRASPRLRATSLMARPSTALTTAMPKTSQKWARWFSQCTSHSLCASRMTNPASGRSSASAQRAT